MGGQGAGGLPKWATFNTSILKEKLTLYQKTAPTTQFCTFEEEWGIIIMVLLLSVLLVL